MRQRSSLLWTEIALLLVLSTLCESGIFDNEMQYRICSKKILYYKEYPFGSYSYVAMERDQTLGIPKKFDAREKWPYCPSIKTVLDHGKCVGASWAFASASSMADLLCIKSEGKFTSKVSVQELLDCCHDCRRVENGIGMGTYEAFYYWKRYGIVTEGCYPFKENVAKTGSWDAPESCLFNCMDNSTSKKKAKTHSRSVIWADDFNHDQINVIKSHIMRFGPVTATLFVDGDLLDPGPTGILKQSNSTTVMLYAMKIIGWDEIEGEPVWLVANSMGTKWGNKGFAYIAEADRKYFKIAEFVITGRALMPPLPPPPPPPPLQFNGNNRAVSSHVLILIGLSCFILSRSH